MKICVQNSYNNLADALETKGYFIPLESYIPTHPFPHNRTQNVIKKYLLEIWYFHLQLLLLLIHSLMETLVSIQKAILLLNIFKGNNTNNNQ